MTDGETIPAQTEDWGKPVRQASAAQPSPTFLVDGFEGPLDWLLEMARARKVDLSRISILGLITAFEQALLGAIAEGRGTEPSTVASAGTIAVWGDWLLMAAELTLLRPRLLAAPVDEAKAAAQHAEALRRRLLDRTMVVAGADWLERRAQLGRDVFARGPPQDEGGAGRAGDVVGLLRARLVVLAVPDDAGAAFSVPTQPFWTVAHATARIWDLLPELGADGRGLCDFLPVVPADAPERKQRCRVAVADTFVAALELARDGAAVMRQDGWADPIVISIGEGLGNRVIA